MGRWRTLQQLREDFKASGIDLGKPTPKGLGAKGCRGKVRHAVRTDAERHLRELRASSRDHWRSKAKLGVYPCRICLFWHVGHDRTLRTWLQKLSSSSCNPPGKPRSSSA